MTDQSQPVSPSGSNSIAIELLRTGTPHNQTLSPGVTYLALCGTHPPAEFRVNLEQYKFSRYLQLLRYKSGAEASSIQLAKEALQEIITKIFEEIPALQTEASFSDGWLHLRLVMTPRELAMLPFELALTPNGFQGARDKAFLLNPQRLTTITREVRQIASKSYNWPAKPRILYAWAAPERPVPADEHLAKLKAAILPWVCPNKDKPEPEADDSPLLTVLTQVRLSQLRAAVEEAVRQDNPYTHIHLLAHGIDIPNPDNGPRFALALHVERPTLKPDGTTAKTDAVDGDRLADALLVVQDDRAYCPAVVTIAACDGGNEGTNLLPGGSLAHVLHQSGVPYVLASQFPLSMDGSVRLVDEFYPRLLHGEDPRTALYYTRKAVDQADIHDWASLVAYARFPDDLDDQLQDVQLKIALEIMKAATTWADFLLRHGTGKPETYALVESRLNEAISRLETLLKRNSNPAKTPARSAEHYGLLGSAYKRLAEHLYQQSHREAQQDALRRQSRKALETARSYYQRGYDLLLTNHWTGVQYLSLTAVLRGTLENERDRWYIARFAAERDLLKSTGSDRVWPRTLAELCLLKPFILTVEAFETEKAAALEQAMTYVDELAESDSTFAKESTARQLERYVEWWPEALPSVRTEQMQALAKPLRDRLPAFNN